MSETVSLSDLQPQHPYFVGIDSDGCAFPSMEVKHKECFIPEIVRHFGLQPISKYAREAAEFVNLYSQMRGANRFPALMKVMDLLAERPEVQRSPVTVPALPALRAWAESAPSLANPELMDAVRDSNDPELRQVLDWSNAVNNSIARMVQGVPPFPAVEEILQELQERADAIVVSATPSEALRREWAEHGLDDYVRAIAGQEVGSKAEMLEQAAGGRYADGHVLMIGDAPGDWRAARTVGALFFPIAPGREEESWRELQDEGLRRFFDGSFAGAYEDALLAEFQAILPEDPPWARQAAAAAARGEG
jgi:phosphoglycolate phosphatase-like HAD superfamily hydrolase